MSLFPLDLSDGTKTERERKEREDGDSKERANTNRWEWTGDQGQQPIRELLFDPQSLMMTAHNQAVCYSDIKYGSCSYNNDHQMILLCYFVAEYDVCVIISERSSEEDGERERTEGEVRNTKRIFHGFHGWFEWFPAGHLNMSVDVLKNIFTDMKRVIEQD